MKTPSHIKSKILRTFNPDISDNPDFFDSNYSLLFSQAKDFKAEFKYEVCVLKYKDEYYIYYSEVDYDPRSSDMSLMDDTFEVVQKFKSLGDLDEFVKYHEIVPQDLVSIIKIKESVKQKDVLDNIILPKSKKSVKRSKI